MATKNQQAQQNDAEQGTPPAEVAGVPELTRVEEDESQAIAQEFFETGHVRQGYELRFDRGVPVAHKRG